MGGSYVGLRMNGASDAQIADVYARLRSREVLEASEISWFNKQDLPPASEVSEIEIGTDVRESVVRFSDGRFVVFKGVVRFDTILKANTPRRFM